MRPERPKKVFISDWELRRMKASGSGAGLPDNAIISPLSSDWLDEPVVPAARPYSGPASAEVALRVKMAEIGRRLYALGFVPATDGNISARLGPDTVLITPSGVSKGALAPEDMSKIDMAGRLLSGRKPSSEYLLHLCFYRLRSDASAVVHAHPPLATGLASAGVPLDKPLTSEIVISLGGVPLARYATPGTEEVTASVEGLVGRHDAIMLANHGVVTCARDLETAFHRMETVEQAAKITLAAEQAGGGRLIPREKLEKLHDIRRRLGL